MKPTHHNQHSTRSGFTLVEIMVVLAIAAILTAVTVGGYSSMRASNRLTSCQANMAQIYQSIRLYAADNDGGVPYYDPTGTLGNGSGIGLWALYTFASDSDSNIPADSGIKPEKRYLTTVKLFHCPSDTQNGDDLMYTDSTDSTYNLSYLSYQVQDAGSSNEYTYAPIRTTNASDADWQRQLIHYNGGTFIERPPTDDTVVLWCPNHRGGGGQSNDNVLFWDGTIQTVLQNENGVTGWQRTPKTP